MPLRDVSRVRGALMDVARLEALPSDDCNVLLVSSRTLYMLANYAVEEVNFLGRYFRAEFSGGLVDTVESGDSEVDFIRETAQGFRKEVVPVTCDLVAELRNITNAILSLSLAGCCPPTGDNPPQPEVIEGQPPPEGYREYDPSVTDRKCKLANMAVDDLIALIDILIANDVTAIANLTVGAMSALWTMVVALIPTGPVGWALAGLGAIASLIGFFLVNTLDLVGLKTMINNNRTDLVCAIFNASTNTIAFNDFKEVLSGAGASLVDLLFLDTLNLLDGLAVVFFAPDGQRGIDLEQRLDGYPVTTDCDLCPTAPTEWVIAPSGIIGVTSASGLLGSGTVTNDGTQFVINSVERANQPGSHVIGLIVQGFFDSQTDQVGLQSDPCVLTNGQITRVDGPTTWNVLAGRRCASGDCGNLPTTLGTDTNPGPMLDMMMIFYQQTTGPFSLTFTVDTPPAPCP